MKIRYSSLLFFFLSAMHLAAEPLDYPPLDYTFTNTAKVTVELQIEAAGTITTRTVQAGETISFPAIPGEKITVKNYDPAGLSAGLVSTRIKTTTLPEKKRKLTFDQNGIRAE